jgi:hypothetical protein
MARNSPVFSRARIWLALTLSSSAACSMVRKRCFFDSSVTAPSYVRAGLANGVTDGKGREELVARVSPGPRRFRHWRRQPRGYPRQAYGTSPTLSFSMKPRASHGKTPRERELAAWLANRLRQSADGSLSPAYRDALAVIPGGDKPSSRKAEDELRWQHRLEEIQRVRTAGGDWPRHQKTDDPHERTLGVWLHGQRIDYRAGRMDAAKEDQLNNLLPGWREGGGHRGGRRK